MNINYCFTDDQKIVEKLEAAKVCNVYDFVIFTAYESIAN